MFDFAEIRSNLDVRVGRRFLGYAREEGPGREGGERPPGLRFLGSRNFVFAYTYGYGGVSYYMRAVNKECKLGITDMVCRILDSGLESALRIGRD